MMTVKKIGISVIILVALVMAAFWLAIGYRTYRNVEEFDSKSNDCSQVPCQDIGRPTALWPYSLFTGPDPRYNSVTGPESVAVTDPVQYSEPAPPESPLYDDKGCIDLSQVKEQVIKDMFDDQGCWVHPYQQFVDAAKSHPGGFGGFYFEGTVVNVYMEDPSQLEAAQDAFNQAYDGDREITEIRAVQGRYSADKLWDWYQAIEDGNSEAGVHIVGSGIRFGDNQIHLTVQSAEQIENLHALMDALSVPRDAVDVSCCGGVQWGTTVEQ